MGGGSFLRHVVGLWILLLLLLILAFPELAEAKEEHVIRVGFDKSLPPLSYVDQKGKAAGFDIELFSHIAEHQGWKVKYIPLELDDAIQKLMAGQLDVVVGMKYTYTRGTHFDFSDSYLTMSDALVVPVKARDISGLDNLKGKVVALQRGDAVITQLESVRSSEMLIAFNQPDALDMLFLGRADVFLGNRWTAEYILEKGNNQRNYRIRTGLVPPSDYAFAVRKGNYTVLNELNEGLAELHHNGIYELLYSQYLEPYSGLDLGWWRTVVYVLLSFMGIIVIILAGIFYWNQRLKKEVREQTVALADSLAFQTEVLDSVDNGILSFDPEGKVTLINHVAGSLLGNKGKKKGTFILDFLPELPFHQVMAEQRMMQGEVQLSDGSGRILHYYIAPLHNGAGEQVGGILSLQDRTEQKNLQARLIAQEKMRALGQVVAGIAHEIRNPLTAIKTFVELLPKKLDDSRYRAELVRHVPEEVERMNRIIEDLLSYSKEKPMKREWENLQEIVQSMTDFFKKKIRTDAIKLEMDISPNLEVYIDRDRIKQVFINLILNAMEAMANTEEKRLRLQARLEGQTLCLEISDSGSGIGEQDIEKLFEPFYTTKSQGIGLGLYICRKIMQEHGGWIEVKSIKGKGTVFMLFFAEGRGALC
jgi:signal transduction histidine kinase/ABC-type amino acid transport substrate-binding protein